MLGLMFKEGYQLIIIEDEEVALAGSLPTAMHNPQFFLMAVLTITMLIAIVAITAYIMKVNTYRADVVRISTKAGYAIKECDSWSIRVMRNQIAVMQSEIAATHMDRLL